MTSKQLRFRDTISGVIRTIRIWFLLRELQSYCHFVESHQHEHGEETGHSFRACVREQDFLDGSSEGNHKKRAVYADFIAVADKEMGLLDIDTEMEICEHCEEPNEGIHRLMRLNTKGLTFIGISDLIKYLLINYQPIWTLIVLPIAGAFLAGLKWDLILSLFHK